MAGYIGVSKSRNAQEAEDEGRKPLSNITQDDILQYGVTGSITFFKWFVKKYCETAEWHHTSPKFNRTFYYDIEKCCDMLKEANIDELKIKYNEYNKQLKNDTKEHSKTIYTIIMQK